MCLIDETFFLQFITSDSMIIRYEVYSPRVDPLPSWLGRRRRRRAQTKSCFELAENWAAISLWVGAHRYTRNSCASKLLQVQSVLKLNNFVDRNLIPQGFPKEFEIGQKKTLQFFSELGVYLCQKLIWYDRRPTYLLSFGLFKYLVTKPLWVQNYLKFIL